MNPNPERDERVEAPETIWLQRFEDGEKEFSMLWFESELRPSTNPEHQRPFHAIKYARSDTIATRMRDRCVDRVKEYLRHAKNIDIAPLIDDLQSLTLEGEQEK